MFVKHRNLAIQSCIVVYSHACRTFWGEWSQSARPCHPLSFPLCFQQSKLARLGCRHTHFEGHFPRDCFGTEFLVQSWQFARISVGQRPLPPPPPVSLSAAGAASCSRSKMAAFTAEEFQKSNLTVGFQIMRRLC